MITTLHLDHLVSEGSFTSNFNINLVVGQGLLDLLVGLVVLKVSFPLVMVE